MYQRGVSPLVVTLMFGVTLVALQPSSQVRAQDLSDHIVARAEQIGGSLVPSADQPVASSLMSELQRLGPDDQVDVLMTIPNAQSWDHLDQISYTTETEIRDGYVVSETLNGEPADAEDFDRLSRRIGEAARRDGEVRRRLNAQTWKEIALRSLGSSGSLAVPRGREGESVRVVRLSRDQIEALAATHTETKLRVFPVVEPNETSITVGTAAATMGYTASASATYTGREVGIAHRETARPSTGVLDAARYTDHSSPPDPIALHSTASAYILQFSAYGSYVNHHDVSLISPCLTSAVLAKADPDDPPVFLVSQSEIAGLPLLSPVNYTSGPCEPASDDFVLNYRVASFRGTGNGFAGTLGAGSLARNVISVGNAYTGGVTAAELADDCGGGTYPAQGVHCSSSYGVVRFGSRSYPKPDVVAPGTRIEVPSTGVWTGTSFSTPMATGFAALLLEALPQLKYNPHGLKALMLALASSWDADDSAPLTPADGAGMPNIGPLLSDFSSVKVATATGPNYVSYVAQLANLSAGQGARVVLVWLNSGSHAAGSGNPSSQWELRITKPGQASPSTILNEYGDGVQIIDYVASSSGTHKFEGFRTGNFNGSVPSAVAIAIVED